MRNNLFHTETHAKCIFAGEHAVLRGCPSLVLPVINKEMSLIYKDIPQLGVEVDARDKTIFLKLFLNVLYFALSLLKKELGEVSGSFVFKNNIDLGAGLGFSAALCVTVTRWLIWKKWLPRENLHPFATALENLFHGNSSGVDVMGVMANGLIHFEKNGDVYEVKMCWQPKLYISYTGIKKNTSKAISKIATLHKDSAFEALQKKIDNEMLSSVCHTEEAMLTDQKKGFKLLAVAIEEAHQCFKEWGLIPSSVKKHIDTLYHLGAVAVKPTGAGGGGYVLSLWENYPPPDSAVELIPLFPLESARRGGAREKKSSR